MADGGVTLGLIGLALAGASTGYQINAANEAADQADKAAREQEKQAKALLDEQKSEADRMESERAKQLADEQAQTEGELNKQSARYRQKQKTVGAGGRADTVLTGPLGIQGTKDKKPKTLLGA